MDASNPNRPLPPLLPPTTLPVIDGVGLSLSVPRLVEQYKEIPLNVTYTVPIEWNESAFKSRISKALIGVAVNLVTGESDASHFRKDYEINPTKFDPNPAFPEPSGTGFVSGMITVDLNRALSFLETPGSYVAFVVLGPMVSNVVPFTVKGE